MLIDFTDEYGTMEKGLVGKERSPSSRRLTKLNEPRGMTVHKGWIAILAAIVLVLLATLAIFIKLINEKNHCMLETDQCFLTPPLLVPGGLPTV